MMEGGSSSSSCFPSRHERTPSSFPSSALTQMPMSSFFSSAQLPFHSDSTAVKKEGDIGIRVSVSDLGSIPQGTRRTQELDLDGYDDECEEGIEVVEELQKPLAPLRASGSKRSRAAEVHNLSEKRRRSRINEKMKALQNLIPNSNKTDKASMLDEAIEYLKQLQLQVQMLSMRNGLGLHPMYLPGALQPPIQSSATRVGLNVDTGSSTVKIVPVGMLPLSQDSSTRNSFELLSLNASAHQSMPLSTAMNITNIESSFNIDTSQLQQVPFRLPLDSEGIFTACMAAAREQMDAGHSSVKQENEITRIGSTNGLRFDAQVSLLEMTRPIDPPRGSSQQVAARDPDHQIFFRQLQD